MFDVQEKKQKKSEEALLKRAKAIVDSQKIILEKIIQQKYGEWEWCNLSLESKAKIISQTVCEYIADKINNKSQFSASVEKHGDYYRVNYPLSFDYKKRDKHEKRLIEATALLLLSIEDNANVEKISHSLPTSDEVIIHESDIFEKVALKVTQLI